MHAFLQPSSLADGRTIHVARAKPRPREAIPVVTREATKARAAALVYAANRLKPWARWARDHHESLGYPTVSAFYRAMQSSKVGIVSGHAEPYEYHDGDQKMIHYPTSADGRETRSLKPASVGDMPEPVAEVDRVVALLPPDPRAVLMAECFIDGPREERVRRTRWKSARYSVLWESALYGVYVGLMASTHGHAE